MKLSEPGKTNTYEKVLERRIFLLKKRYDFLSDNKDIIVKQFLRKMDQMDLDVIALSGSRFVFGQELWKVCDELNTTLNEIYEYKNDKKIPHELSHIRLKAAIEKVLETGIEI